MMQRLQAYTVVNVSAAARAQVAPSLVLDFYTAHAMVPQIRVKPQASVRCFAHLLAVATTVASSPVLRASSPVVSVVTIPTPAPTRLWLLLDRSRSHWVVQLQTGLDVRNDALRLGCCIVGL
jgi:hypothetical protein